jgi:hypothetical protein
MSRRSRLGIVFAALIAVAFAGLAVRGVVESRSKAAREAEREEVQAPQRVSTVDGAAVITLDAAAQRDDGIATVTLDNAPHRERLRAYGRVLDLQPLTELANSYAGAKARLAIAHAKLAATQAEFDRAGKLYKDRQNMSAAQFQAAESAFRVDQAGLAAAATQLHTIALTAQQNWGSVLGQAVADGGALLDRLIARQEVLLQVTLRPGQSIEQPPADASLQLDDGSRLKLRFVSVATRTDPRVQGLSFFFTAPAANGVLPGMSVVVLLSAGRPVNGVVVPASAVVWEKGRAWAYFRAGPETFARRALATDLMAAAGGYLVRGIPDNAEVVVKGAQMLLSEEFRAQTRAGGLGDTD